MVWWQFAALMGSVAGTCLALLAILEYKVDEFCQGSREAPERTRNQIIGRRDGLTVRSSNYHPRSARELPRSSDLGTKIIRARSDLGAEMVRMRSDLMRGQADLQREQAQLKREQDALRRAQAELREQQLTTSVGLAEVRGYLRGLNL